MTIRFDLTITRGDFNLRAAAGTGPGITALFGPSGSGKTTLLNCLSGVIKPDAGTVTLSGDTLFSGADGVFLPPEKRHIGYVFQSNNLFPHLDGRRNILYGYQLLPPDNRKLHPDRVIELLEIGHVMNRFPEQMSGGERSRVAIARALLTSPRILFLDEPLVSVDSRLKGKILPYISTINETLKIPVLYVSHDISEVLYLANEVLVLGHGSLVCTGDPRSVLREKPVLDLTSSRSIENMFNAVVSVVTPESGLVSVEAGGQRLNFWSDELPPDFRGTAVLGLKAADIVLAASAPAAVSVRNVIRGTVESVQLTGGRALVSIEAGLKLIAEVTEPAVHDLELKPAAPVYLLIKARSIRLIGAQAVCTRN